MPCSDGRPDDDCRLLDAATKAACEMAKLLKQQDLFFLLTKATQRWIMDHEERDRTRRGYRNG